jgi:hypothetical protein
MKYDLSILIPSRNEMFLKRTIEDILEHIEGNTEVIVGLDGKWADPPVTDHPRVTIVHTSESIGQRAITNQLCRLSSAKYVMKVDAHCAFDQGFDVKMMAKMQDNYTMVPVMRNLWAFDWVCKNGHTRYQGPSGKCTKCGEPTKRDMKWIGKTNPQSTAYCFDSEPHFQYFGQYKERDEYKKSLRETGLTESMSLQGSCFMLTRDKYWELNICDEEFGGWGSQGIEVAVKTWLSGGRVVCNHNTWYAHMFRTQGGDFSFPYKLSGKQVSSAKKRAKDIFFNNKWEKAEKPLYWLLEKFAPVPGWTQEEIDKLKTSRGILYYTDNQIKIKLALSCRKEMLKANLPITSVTLKPTNFGNNIHLKLKRGYLTMYKQILAGLKAMDQDIVYFCEHDVLYHSDHFKFTPVNRSVWYYNGNYYFVRLKDGFAIHYNVSPLSGLVVYRDIAIKHFEERVKMIEKEGFSYHMGFEPFTHKRIKWNFWCDFEVFMPKHPNIDIASGNNVTTKRWSKDQFRRQPTFWEETDINNIPGWDTLPSIIGRINS